MSDVGRRAEAPGQGVDGDLTAGEARFRTLVERSGDGVVVLCPDGTIAYVNPAAEALLGRPGCDLLGRAFGIPVVAGETTEVDVPRADGVRHAEMRVVEAEWAGQPALLATLRDVTDRRRAERQLRESEERFRLLVDGVRDYGILMLDPDGRVVSWNPGAERLTGYPEAEVLGRHVALIYTPEDVAAGVPDAELEAARHGSADDERWHRRRDGSRYWASGVVTPLRDEAGRLRGFVKILRDLTDRRRMEEELRRRADELAAADRQKNEFLAMLAHELRNPLAPVMNAVHIMRLCGVDSPSVERAREIIEQQIRHMARLVDDLLDVSRFTSGKVQLRKEPIDLAESARRAVEAIRPQAEARGLALELHLPPEPLPAEADPTRIDQVLSNLLHNAVKYTEPGGHVRLEAGLEGGQQVVRVADDGVGIEPELLPRIFDLFTQADRSLDRTQGGLGIGLTMVRSLVELHGGSVEARSDGPGRGSAFTVRLPAAVGARPALPEAPKPARGPARSLRVVVVDDNLHSAESLAVLLRHWGHEPALAHDGPEAIEVVARHRPEVLLLDIGLPRMDGYRVARHLRQQTEFRGLLIVAMTGYGRDDDRRRTLEAGIDLHLVKPVDIRALRDLLADAADRLVG